jgi:hypothetical protein
MKFSENNYSWRDSFSLCGKTRKLALALGGSIKGFADFCLSTGVSLGFDFPKTSKSEQRPPMVNIKPIKLCKRENGFFEPPISRKTRIRPKPKISGEASPYS